MREIKFRAWLKNEKKMVEVEEINFFYEEVRFKDYKTPFTKPIERNVCFEDIELIEYTGLKDKNGVEIFEGDIVKCTVRTIENENYEIDDIGEVVYDDDCCAYFIQFNEGFVHLTSAWNLEVLGNIYKSKELSEGEK